MATNSKAAPWQRAADLIFLEARLSSEKLLRRIGDCMVQLDGEIAAS
jgi:hypothetical protein